jgi:type I restriction enzyme, S subunit
MVCQKLVRGISLIELDDLASLPDGWITTSLDKVAEIIMGQSPPGDSYNQEGEGIPLINGPVEFGSGPFSKTIKSKFTTLPTKMCEEDDLILCVRGSTTGRMNIAGFDACIGRGVAAIRYKPYQQYVNLFIHSNRDRVYRLGTGSTFPNVSSNNLAELEIPLPPLNEQRRIVSTIEQLTGRSHKARAALEDVPKLIAQFRQSVLAAAFRGDLTADWREKNPDVEPASELLERIKIDRLRHAKSPKQIEKINEIYSYEESEGTDALPAHWQYTSLEKLANSLDYGTSAKSSSSGDVIVLRMGNLQGGEIDWGDLAYTSDTDEITKYNLQPNTVLFNRTNSPELVGKSSIYRGDSPAIFAGYLIRIRNVEELDPEYLNYCLNSDYARGYCWKVKTDGVSQSNINAQKLGKFEIPFCSLKEQREIIGQIKRSFKTIKEIENLYQENYSDLERLDRSILAKAFRGELVPQDPNDEPAAVLLDRIRAEREQTSTPKQGGKTTRKNSSKQLSIDLA